MNSSDGLEDHLNELERTDPAVAAAAASYDEMQQRLLSKRTAAVAEDDPEKVAAFKDLFTDARTYVLVDPSDPATIERAARALHAKDCGCTDYDHGATVERGDYRDLAAAVLASLTDTGDNKEQTE